VWYIFLLCVVAAFSDIIGGGLTVLKKLTQKQMVVITAVGSGFLLGATLLDRLPDAMNQLPNSAAYYITIGYLAMLLLERYAVPHHHVHNHYGNNAKAHADTASLPLMSQRAGSAALIGLLIHTFMDGVIIAGAFSISTSTGILIFFAITMHKLPEGFSMATITLSAGGSRRHALGTAVGLAVSTIVGAGVTLWVGAVYGNLIKIIMAVATGTFIYISATNLIPVVKENRDNKTTFAVIGSVVVFWISLLLIKHVGLS